MNQTIDYNLWKGLAFKRNVEPNIFCPICKIGTLAFSESLFQIIKTNKTMQKEKEDWFNEMSDFEARFIGFLTCNESNCGEHISVLGNAYFDTDKIPVFNAEEGTYSQTTSIQLFPKYFNPPLEIFRIEYNCPVEIQKQLVSSFEHFFSDTEAAANRLRVAVEILCDKLKVIKEKTITKRGINKRTKLTLHSRILELKNKKPEISELLLSIKWIGNAASHNSTITKSDLLDGYSFFQNVLYKLYNKHDKLLVSKSTKINKKKKPLSN